MSRNRTYGQSIAIATDGPDAVESVEESIRLADERLNRSFIETWRRLKTLGVELDVESFQTKRRDETDRIVLTWVCEGRQTRSLFGRLLWSAKL